MHPVRVRAFRHKLELVERVARQDDPFAIRGPYDRVMLRRKELDIPDGLFVRCHPFHSQRVYAGWGAGLGGERHTVGPADVPVLVGD